MEKQIIEFMKNNSFLYDKTNRNYKKVPLRQKKFQELATQLDVPSKTLKNRWRTLKDTFYKERRRLNTLSEKSGVRPKKLWKWYDDMLFLNDADYVDESTIGNFPEDMEMEMSAPSSPLIDNTASSYSPRNKKKKIKKVVELEEDARKEMLEVDALYKESFMTQPKKTSADLFFETLASQTNDLSMTPIEFTGLQMALLKTFTKYINSL